MLQMMGGRVERLGWDGLSKGGWVGREEKFRGIFIQSIMAAEDKVMSIYCGQGVIIA